MTPFRTFLASFFGGALTAFLSLLLSVESLTDLLSCEITGGGLLMAFSLAATALEKNKSVNGGLT